MISDFLRDSDKVYITLNKTQHISNANGAPQRSQWSSLAFNKSRQDIESVENNNIDSDEEVDNQSELMIDIESKANFMRILFSSSMINVKLLEEKVDKMWSDTVRMGSLKISHEEHAKIKGIFVKNWDLVLELFNVFAPSGRLDQSEYQHFVESIQLFGETLNSNISHIYSKTCSCIDSTSDISFMGFWLLLLHLAQARFHDIYFSKSNIMNAYMCLKELFDRYIIPFAESYSLNAVLKGAFCSTKFLHSIRGKNDQLFNLFQRYLGKSKDLPTTLKFEIMAEVLFDAKLQSEEDFERTKALLKEIRMGTLHDREMDVSQTYDFNFGEFVEAICRAGYFRYRGEESGDFERLFELGIDSAIHLLSKPESTVRKYYY